MTFEEWKTILESRPDYQHLTGLSMQEMAFTAGFAEGRAEGITWEQFRAVCHYHLIQYGKINFEFCVNCGNNKNRCTQTNCPAAKEPR